MCVAPPCLPVASTATGNRAIGHEEGSKKIQKKMKGKRRNKGQTKKEKEERGFLSLLSLSPP
jgi:hypothetical protein